MNCPNPVCNVPMELDKDGNFWHHRGYRKKGRCGISMVPSSGNSALTQKPAVKNDKGQSLIVEQDCTVHCPHCRSVFTLFILPSEEQK